QGPFCRRCTRECHHPKECVADIFLPGEAIPSSQPSRSSFAEPCLLEKDGVCVVRMVIDRSCESQFGRESRGPAVGHSQSGPNLPAAREVWLVSIRRILYP